MPFLAGVDRDRYKDAIDELNNDFLRHGKEYPHDVPSMVTWLIKRRGKASSKKEDDTTDGLVTLPSVMECSRNIKQSFALYVLYGRNRLHPLIQKRS